MLTKGIINLLNLSGLNSNDEIKKIEILLQDLEALLKVRKRSMDYYCDPSIRTQLSIFATKTMRRINIIRDQKCKLKQYFLLSLLIATTRTWMQFELSKKQILGFTNKDDVEMQENLLEFVFANPPTVKVVGWSSARALAEAKFLLRTDVIEKILKQQVSVKQVENYLEQNIVFEFSFKEYKEDIGILKALSSYDGKYTFINERYTYKHLDKPKERNQYEIREISKLFSHEHTHNFIRYFLKNKDMGLLSPLKFEIRIYRSIEHQENKLDFVESGDYFDHFVDNKEITEYNPYSLLIERKVQIIN